MRPWRRSARTSANGPLAPPGRGGEAGRIQVYDQARVRRVEEVGDDRADIHPTTFLSGYLGQKTLTDRSGSLRTGRIAALPSLGCRPCPRRCAVRPQEPLRSRQQGHRPFIRRGMVPQAVN